MSPQPKIPVVTIMGHVDHGKTSLLDYIRKSHLAAREVGEITQSTGAYQAEFQGKKITFIDTPGHEAFSKMRSRGAGIADIVILVVAANDGVMPQTKESIKIIQEAGVSFLVALNKIDLPGTSLDKIKGQLAENGVLVEGYGGNITLVPISAKTGEGIDQLLEMILLTAEINELTADPDDLLEAQVIEAKADKNCGSIATLVVRRGTLITGDEVVIEGVKSKFKSLKDDAGKTIAQALPGQPALVMGFSALPSAGALVWRASEVDTDAAKVLHEDRLPPLNVHPVANELRIILRTDVAGSLEAISNCLPAGVAVMSRGVGDISDSDILLAKTLDADIYGFNLNPASSILKLAETEHVRVQTYQIIYDLLKGLQDGVKRVAEPVVNRKVHGRAEILAIFGMKGQKIAGARVLEGKVNRFHKIGLERAGEVIHDTKMTSLKEGKQDVNEVESGTEFGIVLADKVDFLVGDVLLSYSLEE